MKTVEPIQPIPADTGTPVALAAIRVPDGAKLLIVARYSNDHATMAHIDGTADQLHEAKQRMPGVEYVLVPDTIEIAALRIDGAGTWTDAEMAQIARASMDVGYRDEWWASSVAPKLKEAGWTEERIAQFVAAFDQKEAASR